MKKVALIEDSDKLEDFLNALSSELLSNSWIYDIYVKRDTTAYTLFLDFMTQAYESGYTTGYKEGNQDGLKGMVDVTKAHPNMCKELEDLLNSEDELEDILDNEKSSTNR